MFMLAVCFLSFKFHIVTSQFKDHIDFQKVGEIIFNNKKYNVLKPTVHMVYDYFKEYMLRSNTKDFPTKRVFIDRNGFRHFWAGFGKDKKENLRKSELSGATIAENKSNNKEENRNTSIQLDKPKRKKKVNYSDNLVSLREGQKGKTAVQTSFFCPFFGVITMTSYID